MGKSYENFEAMIPDEKEKLTSEYLHSKDVRIIENLVENNSELLHLLDPHDRRMVLLAYFYSSVFLRKKEKVADFLRDPEKRAMLTDDAWRLLATFVEKGQVTPLPRGRRNIGQQREMQLFLASIKFQLLQIKGMKYDEALNLVWKEDGVGVKALEKYLTALKKKKPTPPEE